MYLNRFGDDGQVFVRRRDRSTFVSNTINVAVEAGFYDLDVTAPNPRHVEEMLSDIEGATAGVLRAIDDRGAAPAPESDDRETLAVYLALQMNRTPEQRERTLFTERLAEYLDGRDLTHDLVWTYLADVHLGFSPTDNEVEAAFTLATVAMSDRDVLTPEFSIQMMLRSVELLAPRMTQFHWCVEHDRKQRFATSDAPLVLWRPPTPRDRFEGFGVETADEIRFPLDPSKQLVLSRSVRSPSVRVAPDRVAACNQDLAYACHRFVLCHPRDRARLEHLDLPSKRPTLRFNTGSLLRRLPDGRTVEDAEVLHTWVPRR